MAKQENTENLDPKLVGQVAENVLDGWKRKYGEVIIVEIELEDKTKSVGYYKKPTRDIIANCVNDATAGRVFEAREFLAQNTWLGGDNRHQTNDDVAIPAQIHLWQSLNFLKGVARKY